MYSPAMTVPYVENDQSDGHQNADARDDAHADEQAQRNGAQVPPHDGPVLGDLRDSFKARRRRAMC